MGLSYLVFVSLLTAPAADPATLFVKAAEAYDAGDYSVAAQGYETLVREGYGNGHVWFNLGDAYLRAGRLGGAIAAYRRSLALLPRDQDVRANLAFSRKSTTDDIAPAEPSAIARTLLFWHYSLSYREIAVATLVVNCLLWAVLAALAYRRRSEGLRWALVALAVLLVACGGSLAARTFFPSTLAVVSEREVEVHSATSRDSIVRFKLHEGAEVAVAGEEGDWVRIQLPDGKQGWLERVGVEVVRL